ncbi:MAG TPA: hypothetical protein VMB05_00785 [Solirubrobacteraceae bacterium]|nr:hypothetical protein [Solirubrobacteraceae bacterium]
MAEQAERAEGEQAEAGRDEHRRAPEVSPEVARREIEIEASPEEVFEALVTEQGRERWLDEPSREVHIEVVEAPSRLVWWWVGEDEPATRVEFEIVAVPAGARVVVTERAPAFPIASLAASFSLVAA